MDQWPNPRAQRPRLPVFRVWDEINSCEEDADEIEAHDAESAAKAAAESNQDGLSDGLYDEGDPQPISVRDADGTLTRWRIWASWRPHFHASEVK